MLEFDDIWCGSYFTHAQPKKAIMAACLCCMPLLHQNFLNYVVMNSPNNIATIYMLIVWVQSTPGCMHSKYQNPKKHSPENIKILHNYGYLPIFTRRHLQKKLPELKFSIWPLT